jgi:hypothetical protein
MQDVRSGGKRGWEVGQAVQGAAAILARPSALIFLRGGLVVVLAFELIGRPRFTGAV